jgi:hypothetical protein
VRASGHEEPPPAFVDGVIRLSRAIGEAGAREQGWLERLRAGVVAMLGFFDDEPAWARVLVVDPPTSGAVGLECRQRLHGVLGGLLDAGGARLSGLGVSDREHTTDGRVAGITAAASTASPALTTDLVVGGVFSVVRTSLLEADGGKLVELAPSLMAFIVAPYLGQGAARLELEGRPSSRTESISREADSARATARSSADSALETGRSRATTIACTAELPIRATHRTTLVLRAIAQTPYSNNREIAQAAGITDEGQASKLLGRLERRGVIENVGIGPARGEPNAWLLTPSGRRAVELIGERFASGTPRPRGSRAEV